MSGVLGAVLAGGASLRFGTDKAMALWQGRPLIDHVLDALRPATDELVVCGRDHGGMAGLQDRPAPGMGPLGGLSAALHYAGGHGFQGVLTAGCDTPLLPAELLRRLRAAGRASYVASLPVIGYWPAALAGELDAFLAKDRKHAIRVWADCVGAEPMAWPSLANINRLADLKTLAQTWPS